MLWTSLALSQDTGADGDLDEDGIPNAQDEDADGDGHAAGWAGGDDCDDRDATTYPGAVDRYYDGVDSNCDGANDHDRDGDGWNGAPLGTGVDCDDWDPTVHPGAEEDLSPADLDCDGFSDPIRGLYPVVGCACAHGGMAPGVTLLGFGALLVSRRRR